jgi:threonine dehydratase
VDLPTDPLPADSSALSLQRIAEASVALPPEFARTPQYVVDGLGGAGVQVAVKIETLNPIGSFKGRGTAELLRRERDPGPLVTASAGNFGQGLAYAARLRRRAVHVFAAATASPVKVRRMRQLGAEVHLEGDDFDAAKDHARRFAATEGLRFVEDGREPAIAEGAATIAVELTADPAPPLDAVVVPVGNGALVAGIGRWVHAASPGAQVIGVTATGAPAMRRSWERGEPVATDRAETIADGIGVRVPVPEALGEMRHAVDAMIEVDDDAIVMAGRELLRETRLVVEPAGAVALAAVTTHPGRFADQRIAVLVTGSNLTEEERRRWYG